MKYIYIYIYIQTIKVGKINYRPPWEDVFASKEAQTERAAHLISNRPTTFPPNSEVCFKPWMQNETLVVLGVNPGGSHVREKEVSGAAGGRRQVRPSERDAAPRCCSGSLEEDTTLNSHTFPPVLSALDMNCVTRVYVGWGLLAVAAMPGCPGEMYTSLLNVKQAIRVERKLIDNLRTYIDHESERLEDVRR